VNRVQLLPDGRVSVTVGNRGPGDLEGFTIFVQVRDLVGRSEMLRSAVAGLDVGATLTMETSSFRLTEETNVQVSVDPFHSAPDPDRSNNATQVTLSPPRPTATATPRPPLD
jgi:hypothetical protein